MKNSRLLGTRKITQTHCSIIITQFTSFTQNTSSQKQTGRTADTGRVLDAPGMHADIPQAPYRDGVTWSELYRMSPCTSTITTILTIIITETTFICTNSCTYSQVPNKKRTTPPKVGPMLGRRRRRWANSDSTLGGCVVYAGKCLLINFTGTIICLIFFTFLLKNSFIFTPDIYLNKTNIEL